MPPWKRPEPAGWQTAAAVLYREPVILYTEAILRTAMGLHMAMALLDPEAPGMARCLPGSSMTGPGSLPLPVSGTEAVPHRIKGTRIPALGEYWIPSLTGRTGSWPIQYGGSLYFLGS